MSLQSDLVTISNKNNPIRKIVKLASKFDYLINNFTNSNCINIKYKFCKEFESGYIEYKRTLTTYNNKKGKLLRQIYWRLHENYIQNEMISSNLDFKLKCFYVIGLEDSGTPSNSSLEELDNSLQIILESIKDTNINIIYLYLFNEINKSYLLLVKFELKPEFIDWDYF